MVPCTPEATPVLPPQTSESPGQGTGSTALECAICFEPISDLTALPCSCKVSYCPRCWDRALAQSFNACGQGRCPTCRGPVRVDYDAERGQLHFSRETEDLTYGHEEECLASGSQAGAGDGSSQGRVSHLGKAKQIREARQKAICRLTEQALPAQVRILERYGSAHPELRSMEETLRGLCVSELKNHIKTLGGSAAGCLEKEELVTRLKEVAGGGAALVAYWASCSGTAPTCVCGSSLEHVGGRDRARRFYGKTFSGADLERILDRVATTSVICDLCEESVAISSSVWTCESGDSTILHATAYDVCDACFARHACGGSEGVP